MSFPLKRAKFLAAERAGGTAKRTRYMSHMLGGDKVRDLCRGRSQLDAYPADIDGMDET